MSTTQVISAFLLALIFILCLVQFFLRAEEDDVVTIPVHVPISDVDAYNAQEIFNWVVYVTKVAGTGYLEQLNWSPGSRHVFLLSDLRTVLHARNEEERLQRFTEIGMSFKLNTDIVDAVY